MKPEELLAHADFLGSLARSLIFDEHQAQDIAQETWIAALKHPPAGVKNLRAWMAQVARNFSRITHRGESRRRARERAVALPEGVPSAEEIVEEEEIRRKVVDAVLGLDEPYRSAIVLRYYRDLPHKEAAKRLGVPLETMRTRLKKGLALLRGRLDGIHHGDRGKWMLALAPFAGIHLAAPKAAAAAGASSMLTGALLMSAKLKTALAAVLVLGAALVIVWNVVENEPEETAPLVHTLKDDPVREAQAPPEETDAPPDTLPEIEKVAVAPAREGTEPAPAEKVDRILVTGRFLDVGGVPVAGVRISEAVPDRSSPFASGTDGRFLADLRGYTRQESLHATVHAYKKGYAMYEKLVEARQGENIHLGDIILEPGGEVSGRVLDQEGHPVAKAMIRIGGPDTGGQSVEDLRLTGGYISGDSYPTEKDGTFLWRGVPAGWIRVWAKAEGTLYSFTDPLELKPGGEIKDIELVLDPVPVADLIGGVVLDPEGEPLPYARLKFSYRSFFSSGSSSALTDEKGRFSHVPYRKATYTVEASDREDRYTPAVAQGVKVGTTDLLLQLSPLKVLRLAVSTDGEETLDRFIVYAFNDELDFMRRQAEFRSSDLDERGIVDMQAPDAVFELEVRAPGFAIVKKGPFDPDRLPDPIVIRLQSLPGVRGRVLAPGRPAAGARVSLHEQAEPGELMINGFLSRSEKSASAKAGAGADGSFKLNLQESGAYYLRAELPGFAPAEIGPLDIDHGKGMKGLELELTPGGSIQGWVRTPPGREPAGMIVGISRGDGFGITQRAGVDGYYRFDHLTPGRWDLKVCDEEVGSDDLESSFESGFFAKTPPIPWVCAVEEGKTTRYDLDLTRGLGYALRGKMTLNGEAPGAWTAEIFAAKNMQMLTASKPPASLDGEGRFLVSGSGPGDHLLFVSGPPGEGPELRIRDRVALEKGEISWELDLKLGKVILEGAPKPAEPGTFLLYKWKGRGELVSYTQVPAEAGLEKQALMVPAGVGWIVLARPDVFQPEGFTEQVIRQVEVPAGGEVSVEF